MITVLKEAISLSEQTIISPLLDGFLMGNPLSDHDGVRCCPAIKENTEKKYIVKIISVPATQRQMDALLLAGAYRDPSGAMEYYQELSQDICKEAELLSRLSTLEGWLPYESWQVEAITRKRLGYEVYLLGSYKRSLSKHLRRSPMTHLEAMNLGLDLCSALNVCRQSGYLYVDLKPSNVFVSEKKEYRIGDLGFVALDALSYTALPSKYLSPYTPPELEDPMAVLNLTADTYALGMLLYQIYNDGQLPPKAEGEDILPPVNADYELAEILLKAIHPDPSMRWQDPAAMGQALASYMQRNVVNDVPITPHVPLEVEEPAIAPEPAKQTPAPAPAQPPEEAPEEVPEEVPEEAPQDETVPEPDAEALQPHEMSDVLSQIVARADDLIAHQIPAGVTVPQPEQAPDLFAFAEDEEALSEEDMAPEEVPEEPEEAPLPPPAEKKKEPRFISPEVRRRRRRRWAAVLLLAALAAAAFGGYWYYDSIYLQQVYTLTTETAGKTLVVAVDTDADLSRIQVRCADSYGNVHTEPISGGVAIFHDLLPYTDYTVTLEYEGFHKLFGEVSQSLRTEAESQITRFDAVTGPEDGSVILNFEVEGLEPRDWTVLWSAPGEKEQRQTFSGHSTTVTGLNVGSQYTFSLLAAEDLTVGGDVTLQYLASRVIRAENIHVTSDNGSDLTVQWSVPGDLVIDRWDVRCYNNRGYEAAFEVEDMFFTVSGLDLDAGCTVEITASGMTQPARFTITPNPVSVTELTVAQDQKDHPGDLVLSWSCTGEAPKGGWLVMYTLDGSGTPAVVQAEENEAILSPAVPGAGYRIQIQAADGSTVLNSVHRFDAPEAAAFDALKLTAEDVTVQTLSTPETAEWRYETISDDDFTDTFLSGERISLVLRTDKTFYLPQTKYRVLYVFRSSHGSVLADFVRQEELPWKSIWAGGNVKTGELNVPIAPTAPGSYTLELYIEGMAMAKLPITIR